MYAPQSRVLLRVVRHRGAVFRSLDRISGRLDRGRAPAPLIAVAVLQHNGSKTPGLLSLYLGAAALLTVIALAFGRETRGVDLVDDLSPAGESAERPAGRTAEGSVPSTR
jgi:hypothetical protein